MFNIFWCIIHPSSGISYKRNTGSYWWLKFFKCLHLNVFISKIRSICEKLLVMI